MPVLYNRRREEFAQLRAEGVPLHEAYRRAGFAPDRGHPSRLEGNPVVVKRVAELKHDYSPTRYAERSSVISALLEIGRVGVATRRPEGLREARLAYLEALRLCEASPADDGTLKDVFAEAVAAVPGGPGR